MPTAAIGGNSKLRVRMSKAQAEGKMHEAELGKIEEEEEKVEGVEEEYFGQAKGWKQEVKVKAKAKSKSKSKAKSKAKPKSKKAK